MSFLQLAVILVGVYILLTAITAVSQLATILFAVAIIVLAIIGGGIPLRRV